MFTFRMLSASDGNAAQIGISYNVLCKSLAMTIGGSKLGKLGVIKEIPVFYWFTSPEGVPTLSRWGTEVARLAMPLKNGHFRRRAEQKGLPKLRCKLPYQGLRGVGEATSRTVPPGYRAPSRSI